MGRMANGLLRRVSQDLRVARAEVAHVQEGGLATETVSREEAMALAATRRRAKPGLEGKVAKETRRVTKMRTGRDGEIGAVDVSAVGSVREEGALPTQTSPDPK